MSKVRLKFAIREIFGTLYEVNTHPSHQEEEISIKRPHKSSAKASEAQRAQRQHFTQAAAYTTAALADPELRAQYEEMAQRQGKRPRDVAMSDYLKGNNLLAKTQQSR